jgi:hypothetical protein
VTAASRLPQIGHDREGRLPVVTPTPSPSGTCMVETVAAYAYWVGEAVAPYVLDVAFISVALLLAAFWMLVVIVILQD